MDVVVKITAVIRNCCEVSDLANMNMDLAEYLDWLVKNEGLIGILDFDTAEIVQARFRKQNDPEFPDGSK